MTSSDILREEKGITKQIIINAISIAISIFLFVFSIQLMGSSIASLGRGFADYTINATSNPFIGLFIGLLSTAILQSSSTTTTIAVAAVASGTLNLHGAIPIIMGANIGTTLTSTIVSMGYITKTGEFRKAVSAGTAHDFFNIIMVIILFPLEAQYHLLENISMYLSDIIGTASVNSGTDLQMSDSNFIKSISTYLIDKTSAIFTLIVAVGLLFYCIKHISKLLYNLLIGRRNNFFRATLFNNTFQSFGWGLLTTSIVQSSSLTTSLIVPLVATGKVKMNRAFQFILGANIGTTITALLAAVFQSEAAISLAIVHLLFNLIGVCIFLFIPAIGKLPVYLANKMGEITLRMRITGFAYILIAFFLLPFTLIYFSLGIDQEHSSMEIVTED